MTETSSPLFFFSFCPLPLQQSLADYRARASKGTGCWATVDLRLMEAIAKLLPLSKWSPYPRPQRHKKGVTRRHYISGIISGLRDWNHEERGVPLSNIPRHVPLARRIFQQDEVPGPKLPDRSVCCLHLHRT